MTLKSYLFNFFTIINTFNLGVSPVYALSEVQSRRTTPITDDTMLLSVTTDTYQC